MPSCHIPDAGRALRGVMLASLVAAPCSAFDTSVDALTLLDDQQAPPAEASTALPPPGASAGIPPADAKPATAPTAVQQLVKFGARDSWRFNLEGDWISDWGDANFWQGRVGFSWFFVDNVEWAVYGTAGYVSQTGPNAFAGGLDMEIRWHFLAFENWSLFGSIGGGMLGSTRSVPAGGSQFNFTPSVGGGVTVDIAENTRLYASLRWYHISNAGTYAHNPGRDSTSVWIGLSFGM